MITFQPAAVSGPTSRAPSRRRPVLVAPEVEVQQRDAGRQAGGHGQHAVRVTAADEVGVQAFAAQAEQQ